jgi:rhamnulokinase
MSHYAAIDLGASSGRVAVGTLIDGKLSFEIIHRFANEPLRSPTNLLLWNWELLKNEILTGLNLAAAKFPLTSVAVDTWAIDYILYSPEGRVLAPTYSYRDDRTDGVMEIAIESFGKEALYQTTGIQFLPFNTAYQLIAARDAGELAAGAQLLMLPDAINFELTGVSSNEITNASTTQLLDTQTRGWDWPLIEKLGLPNYVFPPLHEPRTTIGKVQGHGKLEGLEVVSVGSHDTASAVAGAPVEDPEHEAYISSGTWSLVGCEIDAPITTAQAMEFNLTNELGVEGKVRLLKNVAGMWIISELIREWSNNGQSVSAAELVELARSVENNKTIINPNDSLFLHPGNMVERITYLAEQSGQVVPKTQAEIARCIYESLAFNYAEVIRQLESVTGRKFTRICVVGGGSANELLNQLTANATALPISAGPVEATLLGNVGVQAILAGEIANLKSLRGVIRDSFELKHYLPA